jgi:DNA helicase-2/ATP-dependent DNA helicase PcrA
MAVDPDRLLGGLNQSQLDAVLARGGPIVVLAGAGSGKTRVLTRRIAHRVAVGEIDPSRVMAVTFTRKAAEELRRRLTALGMRDEVHAGTFHRLAYTQLRERWAERGVEPPVLLDNRARLVGRLLRGGRSKGGGGGPGRGARSGRVEIRDLCAEIDWARARLVGPEHYGAAAADAGRRPPVPVERMAELLEAYQREKRRRRVVDFDDLLILAIRDLRADPGYADAIRWRYRHLHVDEFQDVNPLQFELLAQWRGDRPDLFLVGDPNQAIYGWNGADPGLLQRFTRRERGVVRIDLVENHRSSPQILAVAATLTARPLVAHQADGPVPTVHAHTDDISEAEGVAARAGEARATAGSWSDQAVLVRTNAQLAVVERVLREAGVPVRVRSGSGPLASPEVRQMVTDLSRPETDLIEALESLDESVIDGADLSPAEIERRANLAALARLVHEYLVIDPTPSGPGLGSWLTTLTANDVDLEGDAVELTTFHGAKGLEWPVVHLAGLEDGLVPIAYATTPAQQDEERRLLYVAITRAREELHLSWAASRTFATKPVARQPSPYLAALTSTIDRLGPGPRARVDWRAGLERSRASFAAATPWSISAPVAGASSPGAMIEGGASGDVTAEPGTIEGGASGDVTAEPGTIEGGASGDVTAERAARLEAELGRWRQRRARAAQVPDHVVLPQAMMRAIAAAGPQSKADLAAVPGMTPAKVARFGEELLALVADHRDRSERPIIRVVGRA